MKHCRLERVVHRTGAGHSHKVARDPARVKDLQATMLALLGLKHRRLSYRFAGLDQHFTGIESDARVIRELMAW